MFVEVHRELFVVFPVHPRARKRAKAFGLAGYLERMLAIEPVDYLDMMMLDKDACPIATFSGGVQKGVFFYRVLCVFLREETEEVELAELKRNHLTPHSSPHFITKPMLSITYTTDRKAVPYCGGKHFNASQVSSRR